MLSIFRKKEYLTDYLSGITDIHNHILPGIDDGAANIDDSIQLLLKYRELGITKFICTPHIMNDYYPNTPKIIQKSYSDLKTEITENQLLKGTQLNFASEYMLDHNFMDILEHSKLLTLKENYVLVEMSYFQAPINLNEILFKLQTQGYKPVLAHPERYAFYHSKNLSNYTELKNRGCSFQMNLLSLTPHYGKSIQKAGIALLNAGMVDFVGSDTHRIEHLEKISHIHLPKKIASEVKKAIEKTKEIF